MTPTLVHEETICCGYKRCPVAKFMSDGSMTLEDEGQVIQFNADQARRLAIVINDHDASKKLDR